MDVGALTTKASVSLMAVDGRCEALVQHDWHSYQCQNKGKHERLDRHVCTIHAKKLDKRDDPAGFARFWWNWDVADGD